MNRNETTQSTPEPSEDQPGAIPASLRFITRQETKPYFHSAALTGGSIKAFFETEKHDVLIRDMRRIANQLSIDRQGFVLLNHETSVDDLYDDRAIEDVYYPEIEAFLCRQFDARRVVFFDSTRRSDGGEGAQNPDGLRLPAKVAHVDYTVASGPRRVRDLLGADEWERLMAVGSRVLQVNVWRPIRGPVRRSPLALADASTVAPEDLIATDQVFPDRVGEIYQLAYAQGQRWYFAPEMHPNEVILIKGWDSVADGRAQFTPHSSFQLPDNDRHPPRESIETRTLIIVE